MRSSTTSLKSKRKRPKQAVDIAYKGGWEIVWEARGVVEFDARHVVALDDEGEEIDSTAR